MEKIGFLSVFVLMIACNVTSDVFRQYASTNSPVKLGEGILSMDSIQWNNVFVSQTNEMFYTKNEETGSVIKKLSYLNGEFQNNIIINLPRNASHSDIYLNQEGNLMLFSSTMLEHKKDTIDDWNIWKSLRKNNEWQAPELYFAANIEGNLFYPWLTDSGNLYFSITPHNSGNADLYVSKFNQGVYEKPMGLPSYINTLALEGDAFVAPDESYLIFAGFERAQNSGKSDLYICFNIDGVWTVPVWLGKSINSDGYDGSPFVTSDGKYLIFTSSRGSTDKNTFFNHYIVRFNPENFKEIGGAI